MDSSPPVIANAQASEAAQPRKRTLRDPAVPAQLLLALDAAARDPRDDVARAALRPAVARVIGFVRIQLRGPLAGAPQGPLAGRHRIQHRRQGERVGVVGRAQAERQRDTLAVVEHVLLRAGTPPVGRIAAGDLAPLFARTSRLSRLARDQSIRPALPSRSSRVRRNWYFKLQTTTLGCERYCAGDCWKSQAAKSPASSTSVHRSLAGAGAVAPWCTSTRTTAAVRPRADWKVPTWRAF